MNLCELYGRDYYIKADLRKAMGGIMSDKAVERLMRMFAAPSPNISPASNMRSFDDLNIKLRALIVQYKEAKAGQQEERLRYLDGAISALLWVKLSPKYDPETGQ